MASKFCDTLDAEENMDSIEIAFGDASWKWRVLHWDLHFANQQWSKFNKIGTDTINNTDYKLIMPRTIWTIWKKPTNTDSKSKTPSDIDV